MICPKCGYDMQDEKFCAKCGFNSKETDTEVLADKIEESETEVDYDSLNNLDVDFEQVNATAENEESEDDMKSTDDDLIIDFDKINEATPLEKTKKSNSWVVALVSFVAGVLATLITIGSFNGTIIESFDKFLNGKPYDVIQNYYVASFSYDAEKFTKSASPYIRSQYLEDMKYFEEYKEFLIAEGYPDCDFDVNVDVNDEDKFAIELKKFFGMFSELAAVERKASNFEFSDLEYYKSGTDEFDTLLTEYKEVCDSTKGITLFAKTKVSFSYYDISIPETVEETTAPTTQAKSAKKSNKKSETPTESQTSATESKIEPTKSQTQEAELEVVCVKINGQWYLFKEVVNEQQQQY